MNRRDFLMALGTGALTLAMPATLRTAAAAGGKTPPNIVLIVADDLGWADLSVTGSRYYKTPAIDRLTAEGALFTNNYACGPNSAPSRASLMTGMYTPRHGILTVGRSDRGPANQHKLVPVPNQTVLDPKFVTVAELLGGAGYETASIGKWHLGSGEASPNGQGFDHNVAGGDPGSPSSYFSPYRLPNIQDGPDGEYLTTRLTDEAVEFIGQQRQKPFFLYFPHYAVHTPLQAPKDLVEHWKKQPPAGGQKNPTYAAMVETLDKSVERIVSKIDQMGLRENTCIIFISDNGGLVPVTSNSPLRGGKGMLYEGGIRVPMIVRWPGMVPAGVTDETPTMGADLYATIAELAGAKLDRTQPLDGVSMASLFAQRKPLDERPLFWHFPCYLQGADPDNNDKSFRTRPCGAVRQGDWKLIEFFEDSRLELYNLKDDIGEKKNLALQMPDKVREMHDKLVNWRKDVGAKMPTAK